MTIEKQVLVTPKTLLENPKSWDSDGLVMGVVIRQIEKNIDF